MAALIPFNILENLVMRLASATFHEIGLIYGIREELAELQEKLCMIKAVLLDAEELQERSHTIAEWVRRLKDALYAADDLLDDFATEDLRRKIDMRGRFAGQVRDFFSFSNHLAFRFKMGHRIKGIREWLNVIANDMSQFNFTPGVITDASRVESRRRETHSFEISSDMIGRDENEKEIIELLMQSSNEENVSVVAIVGIGGLGKTSLAQLAYNNDRVVKHFELNMWVCVSDDFDVKLLVGNIIKSATNDEPKNLNLDQLQQHLRGILKGKKYLLVLDDVWNEDPEKWNELRKLLLNGVNGSKIIVTTRSFKVASAMGVDFPYVLEGLNKNDSWLLFKKLAFKQDQEQVYQNLSSIGEKIVKKCKGVPLVLRVLASALRSQTRENQWLSIKNNENLMSLDDGKILSVLKLSYDALPVHLKQCFAYCALFPKDYIIQKDLLVQLWMAQGYIQSSSEGQLLEDVGEQYFVELSWRSFFQEITKDDYGNIISCKMHDLIHDLAKSLSNFEVSILTDGSNDISERVHHVSLIKQKNYWEVLRAKSIRTFLMLVPDYDGSLCKPCNPHVKIRCQYLRVLDLSGLKISWVPKCLSALGHLRYLDLSNNWFDELPEFITRLRNLQTLKLSCSMKLKALPREIRKLVNLRHLLVDGCISLNHMPSGLGQLTELQSLPLFVVGKGSANSNCKLIGRLNELKSLNHLRGKLEIRKLENVRDAALQSKEAILKEKPHLQSLQLYWKSDAKANRSENAELVMEGLQPHPNLKKLCILGYGGVTFPGWMMNDGLNLLLPNLVRVEIQYCKRCCDLPLLDQLPSLKYLELLNLTRVKYMKESCSTMPFFPSLQTLIIHYLTNWKEWWSRGLSFPCLYHLEMFNCHKLTSFSQSSFPSLSILNIKNCHKLTSFSQSLFPCLSHLEIHNCGKLASFGQSSFPSLSILNIKNCPELTSFGPFSFPCLSHLEIYNCGKLVSFGQSSFPCVEGLNLYVVSNELLVQSMLVFSSLKKLCIHCIDDLISLPEEGMRCLTSLNHLEIRNCKRLMSLSPWIQHLTALETLEIANCSELDFPDSDYTHSQFQGLRSLRHLSLYHIQKLVYLPTFTSLTSLALYSCPQLKSLPEGMSSMSSLQQLQIRECPYLATRCQKDVGEDWPKIFHIPSVDIFDDFKFTPYRSTTSLLISGMGQ